MGSNPTPSGNKALSLFFIPALHPGKRLFTFGFQFLNPVAEEGRLFKLQILGGFFTFPSSTFPNRKRCIPKPLRPPDQATHVFGFRSLPRAVAGVAWISREMVVGVMPCSRL